MAFSGSGVKIGSPNFFLDRSFNAGYPFLLLQIRARSALLFARFATALEQPGKSIPARRRSASHALGVTPKGSRCKNISLPFKEEASRMFRDI